MSIRTLHLLVHVLCEMCGKDAWLEAPKDQAWLEWHLENCKGAMIMPDPPEESR